MGAFIVQTSELLGIISQFLSLSEAENFEVISVRPTTSKTITKINESNLADLNDVIFIYFFI